jgi:hypothetical protein
MPDRHGNFKGIAVTRVWPGHRDYAPETVFCDACQLECDLLDGAVAIEPDVYWCHGCNEEELGA